MRWLEQALEGVFVLEAEAFSDERGLFRRQYCARELAAHGVDARVSQANVSENPKTGTFRGFHYQVGDAVETKTITCFRGSVFDAVIDLRPASKTYLKWITVELSAENRRGLIVPGGCANAWLTMSPDTWVYYLHSGFYAPASERGVRYDDPLFKIPWPGAPTCISDKDRAYPDFVPERPVRA